MRSNRAYLGEKKWKGWLYVLPGLMVYFVFTFIPILETVRTSFYRWDGFSSQKFFVGLGNYAHLLTDNVFLGAFTHNLVFIIFYCIIPILIGLALASLLGRGKLPGLNFFRTILFPTSSNQHGSRRVIWRWIFNPTFGPLNLTLKALGLQHLTRAWLGDFTLALPAVGSIATWVEYGFCMILFLAGMQRIPEEYYEASSLDGASSFQQLIHITIPSLRSEIGVAMITTIIAALRVFDLVYVTTRGGPGNATLVTGIVIYRAAFLQNQTGYAAALATVLMLIILAISLLVRHYQSQHEGLE